MRTPGRIILASALICFCVACRSGTNGVNHISELGIVRLDNNTMPLELTGAFCSKDAYALCATVQSTDCLCHSTPFLVCEGSLDITVSVNGKHVEYMRGLHIISAGDYCFNVSGIMHEGANTIEIKGNGKAPQAFLIGDFDVEPMDGGGWIIAPVKALELGSLSSQGLPFYSGQIAYVRDFNVSGKIGKCRICIPEWSGDSCQLWINDIKVADVSSGSCRHRIERFLNPGRNHVEVRISGYKQSASGRHFPLDIGLTNDFIIE